MTPISETYNMNCMEYMRQFPDKAFDVVISDVPYGLGVTKMNFIHNPHITVKQKNGTKLRVPRKKSVQYGEWDNETPGQSYLDEVKRISKHQIIFGADYCNWLGLGSGRIKWDKCVPDGVGFSRFEFAYCSFIEHEHEIKLLYSGMQQAHSLLTPLLAGGNKKKNEKKIHPTQKPVLLYKRIYLDFVSSGSRILDTHLGSGSSRIAAYDLGFDFYATELDKDYFDAQEKRFQNFKAQLKLF